MVDSSLPDSNVSTTTEAQEITLNNVSDIFGFPLEQVYKSGIKFYKEKEKCGDLQVEYPVRLRFMGLTKQVRHGPYKDELVNVGWFDLVGNDASKEWQKLGNLSQEEAMLEFVRLLDVVCPTFKPTINEQAALETSKAILDRRRESNSGSTAHYNHLINGNTENTEVLKKYEEQRKQIQEALNKATCHQFLTYAQQTYPGDPEKQEQLINQLREQHYEQYMSQVYARQAEAQAASLEANSGDRQRSPGEESTDSESFPKPKDSYMQEGLEKPRDDDDEEDDSEEDGEEIPCKLNFD